MNNVRDFGAKGDGVTKTATLADASATSFEIAYSASGQALRVRNGLSPDLATLMLGGQARLAEKSEDNALTLTTTSGDSALSATVRVTTGQIDGGATDQPEKSGWNTVNLRNAPQVRQVDVTGTGSVKYAIDFGKEKTRRIPPKLTVTPEGVQTFPVGKTSAFRVTATDWDGSVLTVEAAALPTAPYMGGVPTWDQESGTLSWTVGALDPKGTRMDAWTTTATFRATGSLGTVETTVDIVIPADGNGNGIADDWEWLNFHNVKSYTGKPGEDFDGDGFSDYGEWVAGTDPLDEWDYIGWERQVVSMDEETRDMLVSLEFRSVGGEVYDIEQTDAHGLAAGGTNWQWRATVTGAVGQATTWWTGERPDGESRMYRIKVPFRQR